MESVDGVEVFVESTVAIYLVKDGVVAHLVLNVVVVKLAITDGSLDPMIESVWTCLFLLSWST